MTPKRNAKTSNAPEKKKQKTISSFFASSTNPSSSPKSNTKSVVKADEDSDGYKIYCDLDGVLCDFDAGVRELFNGRGPDEMSSQGAMWGAIHRKEGFYTNLPWMSDGKDLWNAIRHTNPDILTGVPMSKKSRAEKAAWCKRELGVATNHVDLAAPKRGHTPVSGRRKDGVVDVLTCWSRNKHLESGRGAILIDDRASLSEKWEEAGGIFIHHTNTIKTLEKLRSQSILQKKEDSGEKELEAPIK